MSVIPSNLVYYGSSNMVESDGTATGGAVDFTCRVAFTDLAANGLMSYTSSSSGDTAVVLTVKGRDSTGAITSEAKTLTSTSLIAGTQTFERILSVVASGTTAVGDVAAITTTTVSNGTAQGGTAATATADAVITVAAGQGSGLSIGQVIHGTNNTPSGWGGMLRYITSIATDVVSVNRDWATAGGAVPTSSSTYAVHNGDVLEVSPNQVKKIIRPLLELSADVPGGSTRTFYAKCFVVNNNTTTTLSSAVVTIQAETPSLPGSAVLDIALESAQNGTSTIANRQTAPAGATSFSTGAPPQSVNVPAPQNLPGGASPNAAGAQGVWLRLTLPPGTAPYKGAATLRTTGQTT